MEFVGGTDDVIAALNAGLPEDVPSVVCSVRIPVSWDHERRDAALRLGVPVSDVMRRCLRRGLNLVAVDDE